MITSVHNPLLKQLKKLSTSKKDRTESGCFVIENKHYVRDLIQEDPSLIQRVVCEDTNSDIVSLCEQHRIPISVVDKELLHHVGHAKTSQGVMAIVKKKMPILTVENANPVHFFLLGVSNPSNFGSICRNAAAFGMTELFFTPHTVDPYHPESVRAAGGTLHRLSLFEMNMDEYRALFNRKIYMLSSNAKQSLFDTTIQTPCTVIVGSEMGFDEQAQTGEALTIPMEDGVDSLNVAVSTGIIMAVLHSKRDHSFV